MTARDFDPVFSAALRNELEALADRASTSGTTARRRPALLRPQVWATVVTALVLLVATIGVLRITTAPPQPAGPGTKVVDPLRHVTDPASPAYVARSVRTLLDVRGTGSGTHAVEVPADVPTIRVYLNCAPKGRFGIEIDGLGATDGSCANDTGSSFGIPVDAGMRSITVTTAKRTAYALAVIAEPAPTVAAGPLIDPLEQVRDLRDPDAIPGKVRPLLRLHSGAATSGVVTVPDGVRRLRAFLACTPSSADTTMRIDGHVVSGCMNAIAHWFDFTPSSPRIRATVSASGGDWAALVVPAPAGAKDSPANVLLPYPQDVGGPVVGRARGAGAQATGRMSAPVGALQVTISCRGTGWVEVASDGFVSGRGSDCGQKEPEVTGFTDGTEDMRSRGRLPYTVTPHGDVSWTVTFQDGGDRP